MKKKYSIFLPLLFSVVILGSCKKSFLDREPYGALPTSESIGTVDDMETAVNGMYAQLRTSALFGRAIPLIGDLLADNVYISSDANSNRYIGIFQVNFTVNNTDVSGIWQGAYKAILDANNIINSPLQGTPQIDQLRGEAFAVRALMYFELVKHFAKEYTVDPAAMGVPLILGYDAFKKPGRNSVTEVYTQIVKDLTDAITLLTVPRSSGYFTAAAAKALKARVHLFKGEWQQALVAAEDVINNSDYSLLSLNQVQGYWASNTPRNDGVETLFEIVNDLVGNAANDALASFYDQAAYGDALAAQSLYNLYTASDVRRTLILTSSPTRGNVKVVNKYPNTSQPDKDEVKIIRMSEVYLIAAEAALNSNPSNPVLARQYLNAVATQRDPAFAGYNSTGAALLNDILLERRKELAFEGHRYWDLARYNRDVVRVNLAGNYPGVVLTIPATSNRRIFPLPQSELDANPTIRGQQNPGY